MGLGLCLPGLLTLSWRRLNFSTAFSTNVVSVCRAAGLGSVDRVECSRRYLLQVRGDVGPLGTEGMTPGGWVGRPAGGEVPALWG